MTGVVSTVMEFVDHVAAAESADAFHDATFEELLRLFPSEHVFWTRTDFLHRSAEIRAEPASAGRLAEVLGRFGPTHPAIQTYVADPTDLTPRRMSDVSSLSGWHATELYTEWFRAYGAAHQLSLVVSVDPAGVGVGWTLTRSGRDFSFADLEMAARLLPALKALEVRTRARATASSGAGRPFAREPRLSPREHQVLRQLPSGLTAASIGRRLGITERTVRKHLDAIYRELGCQDRLVAVQRAHERGLL